VSASAQVTKDEYGVTRIPLPEEHNRPGFIKVDGDVYERPVVILHFTITSEHVEEEQTVDFGTFQINFPRDSTKAMLTTNVILEEVEAHALVSAIGEHFGWPK
jgi:hypothetical protein